MAMTPLLLQFIAEGHELLEKSGAGILALEKNPGDSRTINEVFRALHTLKGSSGLFDPEFAALTRVAHAGEDLLSEARNGHLPFTPAMADALLATLDLLKGWLEEVERHQQLPADAMERGEGLAATLRGLAGQEVVPATTASAAVAASLEEAWCHELPEPLFAPLCATALAPDTPVTLLRYEPDNGCFFMGEDPLHTVRQIAGLLAIAIVPTTTWGCQKEFDPFDCRLRFYLVTTTPLQEVTALFQYVEQQVRLTRMSLKRLLGCRSESLPKDLLIQVLKEQKEVLSMPFTPEEWLGCFPSTVKILRYAVSHFTPGAMGALDDAVRSAEEQKGFAPLRCFLQNMPLSEKPSVPAPPPPPPPLPPKTESTEPASDAADRGQSRTLKVDNGRIDRLMELSGELVVAKNAMPYLAQMAVRDFGAKVLASRIMESYGLMNRLVEELQSSVLQVRMLPVGTVFQRFPRLVRDTSRKLDKQVRLVLEGEGTEADKNVIEILSEPLIHLVRNSLDHGMEPAAERLAAGKEAVGEIRLVARQESDRVVIEVRDDGRGVDPQRVKDKALAKGLIDQASHEAMSDHEAVQLIFAPGFSTAEQVSDLSGRGVGMDAVRAAVAAVGGVVSLDSRKGQGSLVRLELPMTMAVTRVMLVEEGRDLYGIPLDLVSETVRIPVRDIHRIQHKESVILRERVLPLFRLRNLLGKQIREGEEDPVELSVLVVKTSGSLFGLVVGGFQKGVDIVLKPLEGILAGIPGFNGAALLGNGRVLLVLNLKELVGRG